jgi:geranylgeranyl diphosphate synthase type II
MAILAGDALLNTASEVMTGDPLKYVRDHEKMVRHVRAAHEIMKRAGATGMIAGQTVDVRSEYEGASPETVTFIEEHKTADLLTAPITAGLILGGAGDLVVRDFTKYAYNIGVAFQVLDDILDFEGDPELIGKNVGKDKDLGKCNYVCVHGIEAARSELVRLTSEAKASAAEYGERAAFFIDLADQLAVREK